MCAKSASKRVMSGCTYARAKRVALPCAAIHLPTNMLRSMRSKRITQWLSQQNMASNGHGAMWMRRLLGIKNFFQGIPAFVSSMSFTRHLQSCQSFTFVKNQLMKNLFVLALVLMNALALFAQDKPKGLSVKDKAPDFTAKDQSGKAVNLKSQLNKNAVVMVFYRGEWCPYCNKELKALEDSLKFITGKGAIVLAISPEKPENILKTVEKTKATYSILYDEGLKIMKSYGVSFKVDSLTIEKYKGYGLDFNNMNGEVNGANLPIPAVYIINKKGIITYRYFDADYRKRPSVKELISHL